MSKTRSYKSPLREHLASQTRKNIADAAERLLIEGGYAGMTIDAVAREAGVSKQTVYAIFGSKRGIIAELLDRVVFVERFDNLHKQAITCADMEESLRLTMSLVRQVYETESSVYALLRGAGVLDPELAQIETSREERRREHLKEHVEAIFSGKKLRPGMTITTVEDTIWCLTSRDVHRMLVQECGWSGDAYEEWLYNQISCAVLG